VRRDKVPTVRRRIRSGPSQSDIDRYVRLPQLRDRAFRGLAIAPATHDPHRQTIVALYLALFVSNKEEIEIALDFWRCYRHIIEGHSLDTIPLMTVSKEEFLEKLKYVLEHGSLFDELNKGDFP